ncbi:cytochrome c oxidase cbb3-type subunit 4 [Paracoccus solventivorans]|uniref:CcoQ/FixQ family Cbb3-type cytochrome c oxidase assembly chaperone n=1 Tax=Paracoccus solventivorans TaxID=53463 RepID=A0A1M7FUV0_9RHOB|nr:CcoQ/FixQ family Cbb3-type cytochrome c oxidase assembly chaperone [Paracoccus solventivorans]SHM07419.1 cytochrome c oxidase cbb3-type subunit 4 [Paracoccus solventivorans]HHW35167.1 CcoQ/FixQ family Cbb3-type cytochrome c oxidase assembly chaperone [Paracoccus solventivorans]HMM09945.1 CcoQ/FixQ family Cbb3-type cytochrome c oxidase assembly chaperone [Paracoccus solventivorans]
MDRYTFLRQLADSWVLLVLTLVFVGVILFVWRPGARRLQKDAAESIFRNETKPAPEDREAEDRKEVD